MLADICWGENEKGRWGGTGIIWGKRGLFFLWEESCERGETDCQIWGYTTTAQLQTQQPKPKWSFLHITQNFRWGHTESFHKALQFMRCQFMVYFMSMNQFSFMFLFLLIHLEARRVCKVLSSQTCQGIIHPLRPEDTGLCEAFRGALRRNLFWQYVVDVEETQAI